MIHKIKCFLAHLIVRYIFKEDEPVTLQSITVREVILRNEMKKLRKYAQTATEQLGAYRLAGNRITEMAFQVPDGEMTPFVHQAVIEIEEAKRRCGNT